MLNELWKILGDSRGDTYTADILCVYPFEGGCVESKTVDARSRTSANISVDCRTLRGNNEHRNVQLARLHCKKRIFP